MKFQVEDLEIEAISIGGHYTCIQFPKQRIAIDMGICPSRAIRCESVFFTHSHSDHMAGVVRHCATREMLGMKPPKYYIGEENKEASQAAGTETPQG